MRAYAAKHASSWYEYVCGARGRKLSNGDLYIVTGCEKALSWGMASYNTGREEFELAFKPTARADTAYEPYHWSGAPGKRNPSRRKSYDPPSANARANQTLFIHGWSLSLPQGLWGSLFGTVEASSILDFHSRLNGPGGSSKGSSQGSFFSFSWFGFSGATGGKHHAGEHESVALSEISDAEVHYLHSPRPSRSQTDSVPGIQSFKTDKRIHSADGIFFNDCFTECLTNIRSGFSYDRCHDSRR
jgi:hypothetical protein